MNGTSLTQLNNLPRIHQAVILAGGQGLRLRPLTLHTPKPMIMFHGKPFLAYIIDQLKDNGITDIVLLVGYLHEKIESYFGNGKNCGVRITYSYSPVEDGTGTRLQRALPFLADEFLLLYSDNYWPLNVVDLIRFYRDMGTEATVTVYDNADRYTKNNIFVDQKGFVTAYDRERNQKNLNGVDIGYFLIKKSVLSLIPEGNSSFEDTVLPALMKKGNLGGFVTNKRYYGLSNLERLPEIKKFLKSKKIIFLDRDGIINRKPPKGTYVTNWSEFKFLSDVKKALRTLVKKGYEICIITNQPGIARDMMTKKDLDTIHKKMVAELAISGINIKKIYVCPHGWDEGCSCRKPNPGLLLQAARENAIDLSKTFFIGDDERDVVAGQRAGCKTVYVAESPSTSLLTAQPDIIAPSLSVGVKKILFGNL